MRRTQEIEFLESRQLLTVVPTFAPDANFYTGQAPVAVAVGDINRDHNLDFVTADSAAGTVTIRRGRGDGTFRPATTLTVGSSPADLVLADLNKDGKLDLAVALAGENRVVSYLGDGAGNFKLAGTVTTGKLTSPEDFAQVKLVTGDFDGDGKVDLAINNIGDDTISFLRGKGTGAFYFRVNTAVPKPPEYKPTTPLQMAGLAAADFDGDGKTDLAVSNFDTLDVLLATGSGHFALKQQFGPNSTLGLADGHDLVAADLDGDHILDLAVAAAGTDDVRVLRGTGGGNFSFSNTDIFSVGQWPVGIDRGPSAIVAANLNADGQLDLATANSDLAGTRSVLANDGTGKFPFSLMRETPLLDDQPDPPVLSPYSPVDVAAGDFTNDGRIDLLFANINLNNVTLRVNTTPLTV